jgi:glycosyltransferase involved in cell wall biosynthesis
MKILHAIRSVNPEGGGVIETVKQFSRAMEEQGNDVAIASLDAPADAWVKECPHRVEALGPGRGNYGKSSRFIPWLREHAREFDAVIVNGLWQFHGLGVWQALRETRQPYFVFPHGMLDPWFKRTYPLKHLKKWLYWPWAEYRVLRDAAAVLFTCEQERRLARESFWLYRCVEKVAPLGIARPPGDSHSQRELFLNRFSECRGKRIVLFLGRIHEKKGCDLLIRAFAESAAEHANLHLVMAGPEQQDARPWRELAGNLGIAHRITWTGMLAGDLKWGALHGAEVFALPSHQENFGIAVVEALACGVPVLLSREVNIWQEVIEDGAGLAEADSLDGMKLLLRHWLTLTPEQRERMRVAAKQSFGARFEIRNATQYLLTILKSVSGTCLDGAERHGSAMPEDRASIQPMASTSPQVDEPRKFALGRRYEVRIDRSVLEAISREEIK